ncbi:sulfurtransferase [Rhodococcoides kyotonense]|uniref:Thiosulfate/3-mercaptopyruvate sulfurtransferase n=1 Tax=Rhodococcoides kyotonense TaxID=398843 RepID=A0A239DZ01_9NOCA|nr:rhodanese-like domain-containing protein [Rhodococcus kyotonensis]SNS37700.1 thiosulfate/3-mercaptopyruvate sulfurtransferase [Rhodococcus kyotonensis]
MPPIIDPRDLVARLDDPSVVVIDASVTLESPRFDGDYRVASGESGWREQHIPGSFHVDLLTSFSDTSAAIHHTHPSAEMLAADLARLGITPASSIVLYDQGSTMWAARLWWVLRNAGIDAQVLDGGLPLWVSLGLPVASGGADARPPISAPVLPDLGLWADKDDVAAISRGVAPGTLICALSAEHFAGSIPTRYSRRGHIPGSLNLSARSFLDSDGRVIPADSRETVSPTVIYCGGGISACLTALALTVAGHADIQIYDGSLEEWSAEMSLPLVTSPTTEDH